MVAVAHGDLAGWDRVGAGELREAVDVVCERGGGKVEDALFFAEEVLRGVAAGAEAKHAVPAEPPGGGHGSDVGGGVVIAGADEDDWRAEVEDGGFDGDVHELSLRCACSGRTPLIAGKLFRYVGRGFG